VRRDPAKKPDAEFYNSKKKDLQTLELFAKQGIIDLYYFDESGFNLTPNLPYAWSTIGKTISIPAKMSKKLNVLGFLNINNSKLFASTTYDRVDTEVVIEVFNLFVNQLTKDTIVVIDNAPTHTSKKFKEHLKIWEEKGLRIFFLPPYSPQLNPIEQLWKFMKYYWIEFDAYKSVEKMKNYVEKVIVGYGKKYEICFG
jgi:transposase